MTAVFAAHNIGNCSLVPAAATRLRFTLRRFVPLVVVVVDAAAVELAVVGAAAAPLRVSGAGAGADDGAVAVV